MKLAADRPVLYLEEEVVNESSFAVPFLWGHHPAFGPPLVAEGSEIDLPAGKIVTDANLDGDSVDLVLGSEHTWPWATTRDGAPVNLAIIPPAPLQRLFYVAELKESWCALRNPQRQLGVGMAWDGEMFPHLWVWEERGGDQRMPFYGRGELVALEPATQFPACLYAASFDSRRARPHCQ